MRLLIALVLIILIIVALGILTVGMHGKLMFRPHMAEDWLLWGVVAVAAVGLYLVNKKKKNTGY